MPRASPYGTRGAKPSTSTSTTTTKTPVPTRTSSRRATMASSASTRVAAAQAAAAPAPAPAAKKAAAASSSSRAPSKWGVFFYVPNLIGYLRVAATLYSLFLGVQHHQSWEEVVALYFFAFALDAVDGYVARLVGQTSSFGGVLDMVTDRTATAGLVMLNLLVEEDETKKFGTFTFIHPPASFVHPPHPPTHPVFPCRMALLVFTHPPTASQKQTSSAHPPTHPPTYPGWIVLCMLDIGSHWFHCISAKAHHKSAAANSSKNFILRAYYASKPFFFACCIGQEAFYLLNFIKAKGGDFGTLSAPPSLHPELRPYFPVDILDALWTVRTHPPTHPPTYPFIHPPIHPFVHSPTHPTTHPPLYYR